MYKKNGFSLIELVISLSVISLLLGSSLILVNSIYKNNKTQQDETLLNTIRESLYGFAITHGRLPCPAENENNLQSENCNLTHGILPSVLLGVPKTDRFGNTISYYVNVAFSKPLEDDELCSFNLATGEGNDSVRKSLADILADSNNKNDKLAIEVASVIVLHNARGKNSANSNEQENSNNDTYFVSQAETQNFDDKVIWITPYQLKYKMIEAGRLP